MSRTECSSTRRTTSEASWPIGSDGINATQGRAKRPPPYPPNRSHDMMTGRPRLGAGGDILPSGLQDPIPPTHHWGSLRTPIFFGTAFQLYHADNSFITVILIYYHGEICFITVITDKKGALTSAPVDHEDFKSL